MDGDEPKINQPNSHPSNLLQSPKTLGGFGLEKKTKENTRRRTRRGKGTAQLDDHEVNIASNIKTFQGIKIICCR